MDALATAAVREFERNFAAGIRAAFPAIFNELGEAGLIERLRLGETHCAGYGIYSAEGIRIWTTLMLAFGDEFDANEAWAREIVNDSRLTTTAAILQALHAAATRAAAESSDDKED
jgi:hypothetical protein